MGLVSPELSLDFRPNFVPKSFTDFLKELSGIGIGSEKVLKIDEFVKILQDEMKKIEAFRRELPLCMLLLNDAIVALKEERTQCRMKNVEPVLEEFIPLKKDDCDEKSEETKKEKDCRDKKNWMRSVQLWNTDSKHNSKKIEEANGSEGRAFIPIKVYSSLPVTMVRKENTEEFPVHGLSFLTRGIKISKDELSSNGSKLSCSSHAQSNLRTGLQQQFSRKQRRCWSPELHKRFVSALQQLGGSQVATPKQIRELMQVDGLTNDEVKSHLQKYRLHTRRVPATIKAPPTSQSLVVYENLCTSQDECSKASSSESGSPQGPFQLAGTGEGTSSSGDDDSMDTDHDYKSETKSWKSQANKHMMNHDV